MQNKEIKPEDKFKPPKDVINRKIGGDTYIYSPSKNLIMTLNKTAIFIFDNCDGKNKIEQIIDKLSLIYKNESRERLTNDILDVISLMAEKGFLIRV
ncbi:PqqD family protein [bacterium]|nr:PqqD family protein [bacterium]